MEQNFVAGSRGGRREGMGERKRENRKKGERETSRQAVNVIQL